MARYDDLNTTAIAYSTVVSTVLLLIIILLGRALCLAWVVAEDERKFSKARYTSSDEEIREQKAKLLGYTEVEIPALEGAEDATPKTQVLIPITRAKELVLQEFSGSEST